MKTNNPFFNLLTSSRSDLFAEFSHPEIESFKFSSPEALEKWVELGDYHCICCGEELSTVNVRSINLLPNQKQSDTNKIHPFVICDCCWDTMKNDLPKIATFLAFALQARKIRKGYVSGGTNSHKPVFNEPSLMDSEGYNKNLEEYKTDNTTQDVHKCQCCEDSCNGTEVHNLYSLCGIDHFDENDKFEITICNSCVNKLKEILPSYTNFLYNFILSRVLNINSVHLFDPFYSTEQTARFYKPPIHQAMIEAMERDRLICRCCSDPKQKSKIRNINYWQKNERDTLNSEIFVTLCDSCWNDIRNELPKILESLNFTLVFKKFDPLKFIEKL